MNLNDIEYYEVTQQFLEDQDLLEDLSLEQYDEHPYKVLSKSERYNQHSFRPTAVGEIESAIENGRLDVKSIDLLDKGKRTSVLMYIGGMFEDVERFSRNSDTWFFDEDLDFDQLEKLSRVSFAASEISRHFLPKNYSEQPYYSEGYSDDEREIHETVIESIDEFFEDEGLEF